MVKLRNPWGTYQWKGDYSSESDCWTASQKLELDVTAKEDGTFWMKYSDFASYFSCVEYAKVNDDYSYSFMKIKSKKNSFSLIKMTVPVTGKYALSIT